MSTTCHGSLQWSVLHSAVEPFTAHGGARYCLRIAYPTCIRHPIGILPWRLYGKIEWCGYPMVKQFCWYVCSFWQNTRMWQTPRQTDTAWRHRPRFHSIVRQKFMGLWQWQMSWNKKGETKTKIVNSVFSLYSVHIDCLAPVWFYCRIPWPHLLYFVDV